MGAQLDTRSSLEVGETTMIRILLLCAVGVHLSSAIEIEEPRTSDVLDLGAWVGTWLVALGAYSGRQERPYRRSRDQGPLDDLPDVYIPNELTANEIEKSFSLAGKKQAVIEANEMLQWVEFVATGRRRPESAFVKLEDGHFKAHPQHFPMIRQFFTEGRIGPDNTLSLDPEIVDTIMQLLESLKLKSKFDDWNDLSTEIDRIYQEIVGKAAETKFLKQTEAGRYTMTSSVNELVTMLVNDTILWRERRWRLRDENDFEAFKEYEKFEENVQRMINSATAIVELPSEMTWAGIKSAIQAMYKKAISQVHVFQFLTKKLEYLTLDREVGLSKLSTIATQAFVDSMYWFPTPLKQY